MKVETLVFYFHICLHSKSVRGELGESFPWYVTYPFNGHDKFTCIENLSASPADSQSEQKCLLIKISLGQFRSSWLGMAKNEKFNFTSDRVYTFLHLKSKLLFSI